MLDRLEVPSGTIVGCSMGGYLAMAAAPPLPLVWPTGPRRHEGLCRRSRTAQRRTAQQDELRSGSEVGSLSKGTVEGLLSADSMSRPELVDYVHALADGATQDGWVAALEAMKGRPSMLLLRQADVRALVVVGELDRRRSPRR